MLTRRVLFGQGLRDQNNKQIEHLRALMHKDNKYYSSVWLMAIDY